MSRRKYDESSIQVLSDIEHCHKRPTMYIGDTTIRTIRLPVVSHSIDFAEYEVSLGYMVCVREVIDNAIDIIRDTSRGNKITIDFDPKTKIFTVHDNSVGVPIGQHRSDSRRVPEVVFSTLRSGKNFGDDQALIIGMNGLGAALTNIYSQVFAVQIKRDNQKYTQKWIEAKAQPFKLEPIKSDETGTQVIFKLNPKFFHGFEPSLELVQHWVHLTAVFNSDIKFKFNGVNIKTDGLKDFKGEGSFYKSTDNLSVLILPAYEGAAAYDVFTVVNGIPTLFGGTHVEAFEASLIAATKKNLKSSDTIHKANLLKGLTVLMSLKNVGNIMFDSQAKTRLITEQDKLGKQLGKLDDIVKSFLREEADGWLKWIEDEFERKNVKKQIAKTKGKSTREFFHAEVRGEGKGAEVYIVEGGSAKSNLLTTRHPNQGILPLRGKIMNVVEEKLSEVVKSETVLSIIEMLDIDIEGNTKCPYDKIILATDADADGGHIISLLITFFSHIAPDLLGKLYILKSPLYVVEKASGYDFYYSKAEFKQANTKGARDVIYAKGLGALPLGCWTYLVDDAKRTLVKVDKFDKCASMAIERLFGSKNSDIRKRWLASDKNICEV